MCEKCEAIDLEISRYRRFVVDGGLDPLTNTRINAMILELEQRKLAIHAPPADADE